MTLTLRTAIQSCHTTLTHHSTKSVCKRLRCPGAMEYRIEDLSSHCDLDLEDRHFPTTNLVLIEILKNFKRRHKKSPMVIRIISHISFLACECLKALIYVCVCDCVCACVCARACMSTCMHLCMHASVCQRECVYIYVCASVCQSACPSLSVCDSVCI